MTSWADYWNADTPIYVSERHKALHYRGVARDIVALIGELGLPADATVLDHGCGEALSADLVARRVGRLYLCDGAPLVRERLAQRFAANERIAVLAPEAVGALSDASLDLIIVNSLVQYLTRDELFDLLAMWEAKLARGGRLVLADVIPREIRSTTDAAALLSFAWRGGFFGAALAGLARTALSDYRKLRSELGLAQYDEVEIIALLADAGFAAQRRRPNFGHNQARMTFVATPVEAL